MRRTIAIAVSGVLSLGGAIAADGVATAAAAGPRAAASTRTVVYAGYQLAVPASWPVYRLDENPARCVRYDVHAVYLGVPGSQQQCPAGLVGRTETVTVITPSRRRRRAGRKGRGRRKPPPWTPRSTRSR